MGSLPYEPHPHDDTKGDACPPLDSPAGPPNVLFNDGYFRGALLRNMFDKHPEKHVPFNRAVAEASLIDQTTDQMTKT